MILRRKTSCSRMWKSRSEELSMRAVNLELKGILQGVGFRPFVYNLAQKHTSSGLGEK